MILSLMCVVVLIWQLLSSPLLEKGPREVCGCYLGASLLSRVPVISQGVLCFDVFPSALDRWGFFWGIEPVSKILI